MREARVHLTELHVIGIRPQELDHALDLGEARQLPAVLRKLRPRTRHHPRTICCTGTDRHSESFNRLRNVGVGCLRQGHRDVRTSRVAVRADGAFAVEEARRPSRELVASPRSVRRSGYRATHVRRGSLELSALLVAEPGPQPPADFLDDLGASRMPLREIASRRPVNQPEPAYDRLEPEEQGGSLRRQPGTRPSDGPASAAASADMYWLNPRRHICRRPRPDPCAHTTDIDRALRGGRDSNPRGPFRDLGR